MERYVEVAVEAPVGPGRTLTYLIPPQLSLEPGHVVWVPLGPRLVSGVVFSLSDTTPVEGTRPVAALVDPAPSLLPHQVALAQWLSQETCSSLYQAANLMLPPDFRRRLAATISLTPQALAAELAELPPSARRLLEHLRQHRAVEQPRLLRVPGWEGALRRLLRQGLATREWRWQRPKAGPRYQGVLRLRGSAHEAAQQAMALAKRSGRQAALLEHLAASPTGLDATLARKEYGPAAVHALEAKGLIALALQRQVRDPVLGRAFPREAPVTLTAEQEAAVQAIFQALDGKAAQRVFLLEGPTGSGKTEVYLRALAHCLQSGRRGIYLAPEISLTPQLTQRLWSRFPGRVGVLHSALTPGQQYDVWWRVHQGVYDVVLGPRSAVFAPQPGLGLIVVDEEHDRSYKQGDLAPRYHARDVAIKLGELLGAVVVLGSATPEVATHYWALRGRYQLLQLRQRLRPGVEGPPTLAPLPQVQVVDMRQELKAGVRSIFSRALRQALAQTLDRGEQAILFLNRRGSAWIVQCRDCGYVARCRSCDLAMTYHGAPASFPRGEGSGQAQGRLACHRCGITTRSPVTCPGCRSRRIRYLGLGTQRVAQEVEDGFGVKVLRWDRDAVQERDAHEALMNRFARGEAQVLVGTQMIAQGLHVPQVTLVGVVLADVGLYLPDFRAGEWAFQLLCQVVGRAGRGQRPGLAIIQTYSPEHYAVQAAAAQDYAAFYQRELELRREYLYPPFSRLARLLYEHTDAAYAEKQARQFAPALRERLQRQGLSEIEVIGPAPAFVGRLRGRYRWHLVLRAPLAAAPALTDLLASLSLSAGWRLDVDPVSLL